jgi:hypothetical protein
MAYKSARSNTQADTLHEHSHPGQIAFLHALDRTHYDTPGSVRRCACTTCNHARRLYGSRAKTWPGLARTGSRTRYVR